MSLHVMQSLQICGHHSFTCIYLSIPVHTKSKFIEYTGKAAVSYMLESFALLFRLWDKGIF